MELAESGLRYRMRRALRQIGEQHRQLHEIRDRLGRALASGDPDEARDTLVRYRHAVGAHFELEDDVFFPALHGLHPDQREDLEALGRDHARLLAALAQMMPVLEQSGVESFAAAFDAFRRELARHEAEEERLVAGIADEG